MNPNLVIAYQLQAINGVPTLHALNELAWLIGASPVTSYEMPIITCFSTHYSKVGIWVPKDLPHNCRTGPPLSKTTAVPVIKLFWWVALETTTNAKCEPGQSQRVLLMLESFCDVMKRLFSTAIIAGQHNVPAHEVFLEDNGCNAGGCTACDVITLS